MGAAAGYLNHHYKLSYPNLKAAAKAIATMNNKSGFKLF